LRMGSGKFIQIDEDSKSFVVPKGTVGPLGMGLKRRKGRLGRKVGKLPKTWGKNFPFGLLGTH